MCEKKTEKTYSDLYWTATDVVYSVKSSYLCNALDGHPSAFSQLTGNECDELVVMQRRITQTETDPIDLE